CHFLLLTCLSAGSHTRRPISHGRSRPAMRIVSNITSTTAIWPEVVPEKDRPVCAPACQNITSKPVTPAHFGRIAAWKTWPETNRSPADVGLRYGYQVQSAV